MKCLRMSKTGLRRKSVRNRMIFQQEQKNRGMDKVILRLNMVWGGVFLIACKRMVFGKDHVT